MYRTHRIRLGLLALALVAGACSDSPVQPTAGPVDLPTALEEMSLSTLIPSSLDQGVPAPATVLVPSQCSFAPSSQSFVCAPITTNGLTMTGGFTLLGSSGQSLPAFDQATVDAVRATSSLTGSLPFGTDVLNVNQQETLTLSGLLSGHHLLDGSQVAHITGTFGGETLDETITTTLSGLVPPIKGSGNPYPGAGTVSVSIIDAASGTMPTSSMQITMTFNGTSKVNVSVTSGGITQHCVIDMASTTGAGSCIG